MEWIKCSDRLPKANESVLAFDGQNIYSTYISPHSGSWLCICNCMEGSDVYPVTHWMPLPPNPDEDQFRDATKMVEDVMKPTNESQISRSTEKKT